MIREEEFVDQVMTKLKNQMESDLPKYVVYKSDIFEFEDFTNRRLKDIAMSLDILANLGLQNKIARIILYKDSAPYLLVKRIASSLDDLLTIRRSIPFTIRVHNNSAEWHYLDDDKIDVYLYWDADNKKRK